MNFFLAYLYIAENHKFENKSSLPHKNFRQINFKLTKECYPKLIWRKKWQFSRFSTWWCYVEIMKTQRGKLQIGKILCETKISKACKPCKQIRNLVISNPFLLKNFITVLFSRMFFRIFTKKLQTNSWDFPHCAEIYTHSSIFGKNFVKAIVMPKKLLKSWFDKIFIGESM